jgi:type IV pilus assembly protein PilY1
MKSRNLRIATLGAGLLAAAALLPAVTAADDTALFSNSVAPNVMILLDNSISMRQIVWHPDYDPTATPSCANWDNDTLYEYGSDQIGVGSSTAPCTTINIRVDPALGATQTQFSGRYLNWLASPEAASVRSDIDAQNNGTFSSCIGGGSYDKYRRSRITAARQILSELICEVNATSAMRFGTAVFRDNGANTDGGYVRVPIADYDAAQQTALATFASSLAAETYTPLGETLFQLYTYFMSRSTSERPYGDSDGDGTPGEAGDVRFPAYSYGTSNAGAGGAYYASPTDANVPGSPVQWKCQKNFIILITDGEPTSDTFAYSSFRNTDQGFSNFGTLIGDYNPDGETELPGGFLDPGWYADDIAKFMHEQDFLPDAANPSFPGVQNIDVYAVGFSTSGSLNTFLTKVATQGGGQAFFGNSAEALTDALVETLADISEKTQTFTAATVPASRATDGNNFFASYFEPSPKVPFWPGHLKVFEFNQAGEVRDKPTAAQEAANQPGDCAVEDPVPGRCLAGRLKIELDGYWDAGDEIPAPGSRNLYVSRYQSGPPGTIPTTPDGFDEATVTAADLGVTAADIPSYAGVGNGTSGITTDEELADAIIRYVSGCEFGSGACVDRGDGNKLWDIFHSNPVVVGPPNQGLREPSYREFVTRYKYRKRIIYAGSNGGFLHGFNTGEYDTPAVPDAYDRGDGVEEMGFMAYPARQNIAQLPIDTPPRDYYFMDGSPVASDVWLYPASNVNPVDVASNAWNQWRTVVVGGMRQGGDVMYALDVTNPADQNSPGGEQALGPAYPSYLWEFPCEDATDAQCNGTGFLPTGQVLSDYMGETWGEPVITRVRVRLSASCSPSPCPVYDRWVAIFGGGYAEEGDPNHSSYDATVADGTSRAGRAVFMVDITSGEVLGMRRFDNNAADGDVAMRYAFAAAPAVFDLNFDGYADVVYFGDLGGNLWKWVISDDVVDPINASGDEEQRWDGTDGWKWLKLLTAASCGPIDGCTGAAPAPAPHYRSFFYAPTGALVGSDLWLALGSGERNALSFVGSLDAQKNRFYVFHDSDPLERELSLPALGVARYTDAGASPHFVDASSLASAGCVPPAGSVGYYIEGEQGEKFITNSEVFFGVVVTGSFIPNTSGDPCEAGGDAYLYGFDLLCGEGVLPDPNNSGSTVTRVSVGEGLPNRPRVSVGPVGGGGGGGGGCEDMVVVITSEGEAFSECPGGRPDSGVSLKTWRDM